MVKLEPTDVRFFATPADLREQLLADHPSAMQTVVRRAVERGEVTAAHLAPRIISLPFDLVRHEALMTLKPITPETILEIVDDIFLPLVSHRPDLADDPTDPQHKTTHPRLN